MSVECPNGCDLQGGSLLRVATQTGSVLSGDPLLLHQAGNYALGWLIDTYNTESPQEPSGG